MFASRQAEYTVLADRQMLYTGSQSGPINSQLVTSPLRPWVNSSALQQKQDPSPVEARNPRSPRVEKESTGEAELRNTPTGKLKQTK